MTVADLIEILQSLDPDLRIVRQFPNAPANLKIYSPTGEPLAYIDLPAPSMSDDCLEADGELVWFDNE